LGAIGHSAKRAAAQIAKLSRMKGIQHGVSPLYHRTNLKGRQPVPGVRVLVGRGERAEHRRFG
jgi:hypothetical protein